MVGYPTITNYLPIFISNVRAGWPLGWGKNKNGRITLHFIVTIARNYDAVFHFLAKTLDRIKIEEDSSDDQNGRLASQTEHEAWSISAQMRMRWSEGNGNGRHETGP